MSFIRHPLERLAEVKPIEAAAVGVSVFTIGWLARHFREHRRLVRTQDATDDEGEDTDSIDCLKHEELSRYWKPWDSDRFHPTEKCFHPLERITSFNLELANSDMPPSEVETVKPLSLVLNDGHSSCSTMLSPEWQTCTRSLLDRDKSKEEVSSASWFSFFNGCCCFQRSRDVVPMEGSVFTGDSPRSDFSSSPFTRTKK